MESTSGLGYKVMEDLSVDIVEVHGKGPWEAFESADSSFFMMDNIVSCHAEVEDGKADMASRIETVSLHIDGMMD